MDERRSEHDMQTPEEGDYAHRLRDARERSGKSVVEMAALLDLSRESYQDLEVYDEEIIYTLSLQELITLSKALGIDLVEFFSNGASKPAESLSLDALAERINEYRTAHNLTVAEFEEAVGWEVANCLNDPSQFMNFNVDGLMDVSKPLGVDWRAVLAHLST
jgi:transcriptional regulator with XRE-family HTH domain